MWIIVYLICAMLILTLHAFIGKKYYGFIYGVVAIEDLIFLAIDNIYIKILTILFFIFEIIYFYLHAPNKRHKYE